MRRLEFLITEVRNSTDNKDTNGVSNNEIIQYFNDAQRFISNLIFKSNPYADLFKVQLEYTPVSTGIYALPADIFAVNAISMVEGRYSQTGNNDGFTRIKPISESEASYIFGYYTRDGNIIITGQNTNISMDKVRITYFKKLPTLDIRRGTVGVVTANTSIAITSLDATAPLKDDNYSTANQYGAQVVSGIYSASTASPLLTATTTGVISGQYLLSGTNSCNSSILPDACETYLLDYVKQRVYTRNNYQDSDKQVYFTEQQKADIISLFSKNKKDDDTVPVTDMEFLYF